MFEMKVIDEIYYILVNPREVTSPYSKLSDLLHLEGMLDRVRNQKNAKGLVFYNNPKTNFSCGLDLGELVNLKNKDEVESWVNSCYKVFDKLISLDLPKIALVRGLCYGFGLELILSCDVRIASNDLSTQFSFLNLEHGLVPAFFSSFKMPQLIGLKNSFDLVLSRRKISSYKACAKNLIDETCPSSFLLNRAMKYIEDKESLTLKRSGSWGVEITPIGRKLMYRKARSLVEEKTKGFYPSYFNALKLLYLNYKRDQDEIQMVEKRIFISSFMIQQTQNVIHVASSKSRILEDCLQKNKTRQREHYSFCTYGSSALIAKFLENSILAGFCFYFYCPHEKNVSLVLKKIYKNLLHRVDKRELSNDTVRMKMSQIIPRPRIPDNVLSDFVLCFDQNEDSHIDSKQLWIDSKYFKFHPTYPLLELVSSDSVINSKGHTLYLLATRTQTPLFVTKSPGFSFNVVCSYLLEVFMIHFEGNSIQHINKSLLSFGFFVSPFVILDDIGFLSFRKWLSKRSEVKDYKFILAHIDRIIEGPKEVGSQPFSKDPSSEQLILAYQNNNQDNALYQNQLFQDKVNDRCILTIINASADLVKEKVINDYTKADYGVVASCGFPDFWGGPFKYCDTIGLNNILGLFSTYEKSCGARFKACDLLSTQNEKGVLFCSSDPK